MRAVVIREHGDFDRLLFEDLPVPEPGAKEVRVAVRAAGLNHLDTWVRRGVAGHTFPLPLIPGSDAAGVVDALGSGCDHVAVGDEVVVLPGTSCGVCAACQQGEDQLCRQYGILGETRDGTCAEYVVVPAANVVAKPAALSFAEAASVSLVYQTAWAMLKKARLRAGEHILVHAGGSGVGSAAVQIAGLLGAQVIATAGGPDKCEAALALGAHHAIDYKAEDFAKAVKAWSPKRGVDVVFEHVGAETFAGSIRCLVRGGRLVTCGATTGGEVTLSLHQLFFKNLELIGNTMGSKGDLLRVLELVDQGALKPVLSQSMPMSQLREAHRLLESRAVFGKIVVDPSC